ncbi:MAG: hypothetical protein RR802_08825 [Erysipelotrichaceae bacterium]
MTIILKKFKKGDQVTHIDPNDPCFGIVYAVKSCKTKKFGNQNIEIMAFNGDGNSGYVNTHFYKLLNQNYYKFKLDTGYYAYQVYTLPLTWGNLCDHCNEQLPSDFGKFYIPCMNHLVCYNCFDTWVEQSKYYDKEISSYEKENCDYFEKIYQKEKFNNE